MMTRRVIEVCDGCGVEAAAVKGNGSMPIGWGWVRMGIHAADAKTELAHDLCAGCYVALLALTQRARSK